jgi:short-subunit dehydrogenase
MIIPMRTLVRIPALAVGLPEAGGAAAQEPLVKDLRNQTALVTGASSGIGAAFARALAARGAHLVLAARSTDKLEALAGELSTRHGVRAVALHADLARPGAGAALARAVAERGLTVDVLVNNAGFATYGPFETLSPERDREELQVNVVALADLCHAYFPAMLARGRGAIVNVASTGAFAPVPYMAVYGATKAFVLSLSEALWVEARGRGVSVLALCPGPVETGFFEAAGAQGVLTNRARPEVVVERALRALARGRSHVVPGLSNWLLVQSARFSPRQVVARLAASMMRPRPAPAAEPAAGR